MEQRLSRNPTVDFVPMKNESVLFQPQTNKFCLLNNTAAFVWNELKDPRTASEHAKLLSAHFDSVSSADAMRDVEAMLSELLSSDFLESSRTQNDEHVAGEAANEQSSQAVPVNQSQHRPKYEPPRVKFMSEQEVLSAFQVTAAGTTMWWV